MTRETRDAADYKSGQHSLRGLVLQSEAFKTPTEIASIAGDYYPTARSGAPRSQRIMLS